MKTTEILLLGVAISVTLVATQNLWAADSNSQLAEIMQNSALVHSPKIIEQFPDLARINWGATAASKPNTGVSQLAEVEKNQALANNPRMKELFPQLERSGQTPAVSLPKQADSSSELTEVLKNQAFANSPRMKELFPELKLRDSTTQETVEVAPFK